MPDPSGVLAERSATSTAAIILAAGKSTRMRSKLPKPLHPICGLPMAAHVIRACRAAGVQRVLVVVGHEADTVRAGLGDGVEYALQEVPRGTGDAVRATEAMLADWPGTILVLAGDVPLLPPETLRLLLGHHTGTGATATLLTAFMEDPTGYGRVIRDAQGHVLRIVEEKDATPEERAVQECNISLYAFQGQALWKALRELRPANAQGEFYLTDTIRLLAESGVTVEAVPASDSRDALGVNNRVELAAAAAILRQRLLADLMLSGVSITDPSNTYVEVDVTVGQDTIIEPNTYLYSGTQIGEDCVIGPLARIERSSIGNNVRILASQVVDSQVESDVRIGPFANLRPGTRIGKGAHVGDFVELKNTTLGAGAKANHLSYLGDAEIGEGTNIGAGTITCNYDGFDKHRTVIGKNAFIGTHSTLIAPLSIGEGAFIAAASPLGEDVPADAMAIARSRATIKDGWAARYRQEKLAANASSTLESKPIAEAEV